MTTAKKQTPKKTPADSNFCARCKSVRDFYAGAERRLFCCACDWPLNEAEAIEAAETAEDDEPYIRTNYFDAQGVVIERR